MDALSAVLSSGASAFGALSGDGNQGTAASPQPFADLFTETLGQVNQLEEQAQKTVTQLMTGTGVDVHQAVIAAEKVTLAFEMVLSVRNKAVQAYQQVMNMQF